jgi:hypothetical protein
MELAATQTEPMVSERPRELLPPVVFWICAVAVTSALLVLRRPDAVFHAQFWAEDGVVWYADAYNRGALRALLLALDGYLQTLPRLACAIALWAPLERAPLVTNLIALLIEALSPLFLLSNRMRNLGPLGLRCGLALLLLFVPDASEVHAAITDAEFQMAVLACLVIIAEVPRSRAGRVFDVVILTLFSLTGPFCVLLFPVALLRTLWRMPHFLDFARDKPFARLWRKEPALSLPKGGMTPAPQSANAKLSQSESRWRWVQLALLAAGGLVQGLTVLTTAGARLNTTLGASVSKFVQIVAGQIVLPVFLGRNPFDPLSASLGKILLASVLTFAALCAFAYGLTKGSLALRGFILFALLVLTAALAYPTIEPVHNQWVPFLVPGQGLRYWYIPKLALMATLVWLLGSQRPMAIRLLAGVLACVMGVALVTHWRYPALPDFRFESYVQAFEQLPPGATGKFRLNPGGPWVMKLVKK